MMIRLKSLIQTELATPKAKLGSKWKTLKENQQL
jgi:hypothetical protein